MDNQGWIQYPVEERRGYMGLYGDTWSSNHLCDWNVIQHLISLICIYSDSKNFIGSKMPDGIPVHLDEAEEGYNVGCEAGKRSGGVSIGGGGTVVKYNGRWCIAWGPHV